MTRQAILAIVIGVIIVLGASAAFLYSRINQEPKEEAITAQNQETVSNKSFTPETIVGLLSKGENAKCTFSADTEEGNSSGTIYISGENARVEFEVNIEDDRTSTNIIRSGDTFYMWGDTLETGIIMEMDINEWAEVSNEAQSGDSAATIDPNAQVDFQCSDWTVDSALFSPPEDIEFISFTGIFQPTRTNTNEASLPETSNETNTGIQCSLCDSLSGDAKTICLQNCE